MYPFTPNSPKNCHSSWPDTNPAPKKHPAKANASGMIFISFMFTLPLTIYVYYNKAGAGRRGGGGGGGGGGGWWGGGGGAGGRGSGFSVWVRV